MQKAIIVWFFSEKKNNLEELNNLLSDGWKVMSQKPMGAGETNVSVSLVIVEK